MTRYGFVILAATALFACDEKPAAKEKPAAATLSVAPKASSAPPPASAASTAAVLPAAPSAPAGPATKEAVTAELKALLADWVSAQNGADLGKYFALYDDASFKGTKRIAKGKEKTYDFAGWRADREKLLAAKPKVAADNPQFVTWHDGKLADKAATITFVQRWKAKGYADHGKKVLTLVRTDKGLRITREEMVAASAGWGDVKPGGQAGAGADRPGTCSGVLVDGRCARICSTVVAGANDCPAHEECIGSDIVDGKLVEFCEKEIDPDL